MADIIPGLGTVTNPLVDQAPWNSAADQSELSPLQRSGYDLSILKYPLEVGGVDVPSYVVFNIYVPPSSPYSKTSSPSTASVQSASQTNSDTLAAGAGKPQSFNVLGQGASTAGAISAGQSIIKNGFGAESLVVAGATGALATVAAKAVSNVAGDLVTLKPQLVRIDTSIQIYMPDTVMMSMNHDYGAISATDAMGSLGLAAVLGNSMAESFKGAVDSIKKAWTSTPDGLGAAAKGIFKDLAQGIKKASVTGAGREFGGGVLESTGLVGPGFTDLSLRNAGIAINPQVELIYRGTSNRSFVFEFRFQPRSAKEANNIKEIIKTFKKFSSPGIQKGTLGRYFIVPGQFDISFKFQNTENPFIGRISTCVLESIDVNYSAAGQFATMTDGAPVEINMMLRFKEAEIIYDDLVDQGF